VTDTPHECHFISAVNSGLQLVTLGPGFVQLQICCGSVLIWLERITKKHLAGKTPQAKKALFHGRKQKSPVNGTFWVENPENPISG